MWTNREFVYEKKKKKKLVCVYGGLPKYLRYALYIVCRERKYLNKITRNIPP